jgi:formate hydrogenlyase subunit 4
VLAGGIIPILSVDLPLARTADVIVFVALFAIARFFTALAGMDVGTAFGGMGSSREMTIASLAEPAMLMAIFTISLGSASTSLAQIVSSIQSGQLLLRPSFAFALIAFTSCGIWRAPGCLSSQTAQSRATAASGPVIGVSTSLVTIASARILLSALRGFKEFVHEALKRRVTGDYSGFLRARGVNGG